jgi:single-stranded DNA-binding protein
MALELSESAKVKMRGRVAGKPQLAQTMGGELVCRFTVVREVGPASCPVDLPFYVRGELARRCGTNLCEGDLVEVLGELSLRMRSSGRGRARRDYGALAETVRLKERGTRGRAGA